MTETTPAPEPEDVEQEQSGYSTGFGDTEGRSGIDTGGANDDLHGQAREVAESAKGAGPSETPAG